MTTHTVVKAGQREKFAPSLPRRSRDAGAKPAVCAANANAGGTAEAPLRF
jgi:hypothetical protein